MSNSELSLNTLTETVLADTELQHLREAVKSLSKEASEPFEQSENFRDFIVWLCGFTERHELPGTDDWEHLREEAKKIAAKFALATRSRRRDALTAPEYYYAEDTAKAGGDATVFQVTTTARSSGPPIQLELGTAAAVTSWRDTSS